ncbi:MAG: enoyl-CoA hydratase/isomerase family protein [Acetobacteraceae bacterium]
MADMLDITIRDYIATVVMNRPPVNAQNTEFREEVMAAFDSFTDRDDVRVVILTGTGKMFSAGADMKTRPSSGEAGEYWAFNRYVREMFNSIHECARPVICAVNGPALGAGFGLVAACDIILASDNAVFGMPEIDIGLMGGAAMLQQFFGRSRARRMFYTGWRVPAEELYRTGVIECCVPLDQLMPEAMKIATDIASKSPLAMRYAKQSMNVTMHMPAREGYRFEQGLTVALSKSEDAREAREAFFEKRRPVWKGR